MKIGVVCDNYKVKYYETEFKAADLIFTKSESKDLTTFNVTDTTPDRVQEICTRLETYFKSKLN